MGARETAPTYVTEDMEAHPFVCPASRCTYGSTGHVTKAYVCDSNQFKIYIVSEVRIFWVYGDFSATVYITGKYEQVNQFKHCWSPGPAGCIFLKAYVLGRLYIMLLWLSER